VRNNSRLLTLDKKFVRQQTFGPLFSYLGGPNAGADVASVNTTINFAKDGTRTGINNPEFTGNRPFFFGKGGATPDSDGKGVKSDGSLVILNSNKNSNVTIKFSDMFPTSVGSIELNTSGADVSPPTFNITFKYNGYDISV
jgi:hypothetical protein